MARTRRSLPDWRGTPCPHLGDLLARRGFFGPAAAYSIGYKVARTRHRGGVRLIDDLDLYEVSGVLHGANRLARLQSIKSGRPRGLEVKRTPAAASVPMTPRRRWALRCGPCGQPVVLADARLRDGAKVICRSCLDSIEAMVDPFATPDLDDATAPDPTIGAVYERAQRDEATFHAAQDGSLRAGLRDRRRP
ncbi:MAG: hypothetical protein ACRDRK_17705 [Pseudonocardia sp.]